jgi:prepilin-type N-terminal cleavage/methylation domain-containing protein
MKSKQSGFTLVEIAIVLVIVGLLLGGVLKGQELITSGKAKALYADKAALQTAYNIYQDRFRALPGDDNAAARRFSGQACGVAGAGVSAINSGAGLGCSNGNGNGAIFPSPTVTNGTQIGWGVPLPAGTTFANNGENETFKMFQHLRAAQVIKTDGLTPFSMPTNNTGGMTVVNTEALYIGQQPSLMFIHQTAVPGNIAGALDAANDDGFTNLGGIRAAANGTVAAPNSVTVGVPYPAAAGILSTNLL